MKVQSYLLCVLQFLEIFYGVNSILAFQYLLSFSLNPYTEQIQHISNPYSKALTLLFSLTVVSWVSAHGRLNITRNFGPHGCLPGV